MHDAIRDMYLRERTPTGFTKHYYTLLSVVDGLEVANSFEFGTGFSTVVIAETLKKYGGHHTSCDVRRPKVPELDRLTNWTFLKGDSREVFTKAQGPFDFVLHDGSHLVDVVKADIRNIMDQMKQDSILMVHDTDSPNYGTDLQSAVRMAMTGMKHELVTLPYGYGLTIVRILGNGHNGRVQPRWKK